MNKDSKMLAEAYDKISLIKEDQDDRKGQRCEKCKKGVYGEESVHDDWEGKVTCDKCGHRPERYRSRDQQQTSISKSSTSEDTLLKQLGIKARSSAESHSDQKIIDVARYTLTLLEDSDLNSEQIKIAKQIGQLVLKLQ